MLRDHADVFSGLEHLATMVSSLPTPSGHPPHAPSALSSDPEQAVEMVAQCEVRLTSAYKFIQGMPKASRLLEDMRTNLDLSFA